MSRRNVALATAVLGGVIATAWWSMPASSTAARQSSAGSSQAAAPCAPPQVTTRSDKNSGAIDYVAHPRIRPLGSLRAIMLFVDFPDAPATESTSALYNALVPAAQTWFSASSYGRMSLTVKPVDAWLRLPRSSTTYISNAHPSFDLQRELLQDAVNAADPTVDFAGYQLLYVVASWPSGVDYSPGFTPVSSAFGVSADGNTLLNGSVLGGDIRDAYPGAAAATLAHETIHTFGLPDLWHFGNTYPSSMDFVGGWSLMSSKVNFPGLLAWERLQLGWLDLSEIACITTPEQKDVVLEPLEEPGGTKAAIVQTSPTTFVAAEVREPKAEDGRVCDTGVVIYRVDARVEDGMGALRVQPAVPDDGSQAVINCSLYYRAAYRPDRVSTFVTADGHVRFEVLAQLPTGFQVRVTCSAPACAGAPPPPPAKPKCLVPNVVGRLLATAKGRIGRAHCLVGAVTHRPSAKSKANRVLRESPTAGKRLKYHARVRLLVGRHRG